ncbi:triose-phosphate isomerase [soil metagenome]
MQYLIANWKTEITFAEIQIWTATFTKLISENSSVNAAIENKDLCIVVCPPYPFIAYVEEQLQDIGVYVGSQDVSKKDQGKYTGEVTAQVLRRMVDFAIVGHSERRTNFKETDEDIAEKIQQCTANDIQPILCIRGTEDKIPAESKIIAYEPVAAIGTGQNADPASVVEMKKQLALAEDVSFLYGGSVKKENIRSYHDTGEIQGYLVGSASLDATNFCWLALELIK